MVLKVTNDLPHSSPEKQGISSSTIHRFVEALDIQEANRSDSKTRFKPSVIGD